MVTWSPGAQASAVLLPVSGWPPQALCDRGQAPLGLALNLIVTQQAFAKEADCVRHRRGSGAKALR